MIPLEKAFQLKTEPKLLISDGAGTFFDPGSMLPAIAFQQAFDKMGYPVSMPTIQKYMGRQKLEHINLILQEPDVFERFLKLNNRRPDENDLIAIYNGFKEELYVSAVRTAEIPGVKEQAYLMKEAGIPIIITTGYDRRMVDETRKAMPWLDEVISHYITSNDVMVSRPAPFMIYQAMEFAKVDNPAKAVKVGDTKVDVEAADNACMPGITVTSGSVSHAQAVEINEMTGRDHLIVENLADVMSAVLDGSLQDRILDCSSRPVAETTDAIGSK